MMPPQLPTTRPPRLTLTHAPRVPAPADGVGAELSKLLSLLGFAETAGCQCKNRIATMNRRGIPWCEANRSTIIDWLQEGAQKQSLPFSRWIAGKLLSIAIRRARRKHQ